jgi:hypothetical protein
MRPVSFSVERQGGGEHDMPSGGGSPKDKKNKKKSKAQLEKELKKQSAFAPVESMTFEVIKPKRKEREF